MDYVYSSRIRRVCFEMKLRGIDVLLLTPCSDMKYLIGYEHPQDDKLLFLVVLGDGGSFVIHNRLHDIDPERTPVERVISYAYKEDPVQMLCAELKRRGIRVRTAAMNRTMPVFPALRLKENWPEAALTDAEELTAPLRAIKDEDEMEAAREACRRAEEALRICMEKGAYWVGKTEQQLEAGLLYEMGNLGLRRNAASVCFGENAAFPHHHPDSTVITYGKPLLIDFGAEYGFLNTDMTRMFFFGEPDAEYQKLYQVVREAERRGIEAAVCGNTLQELDRAVREYLEQEGYGRYYIHRTSHGVGLDCHDYPKIPVDGETTIQDGMMFSVEPGVYFPGKYGIRIEDQILMKDGRAEVLHSFTKDLTVIRPGRGLCKY